MTLDIRANDDFLRFRPHGGNSADRCTHLQKSACEPHSHGPCAQRHTRVSSHAHKYTYTHRDTHNCLYM